MINYFGFKPKPETKSLKTSNNVSGGRGRKLNAEKYVIYFCHKVTDPEIRWRGGGGGGQ